KIAVDCRGVTEAHKLARVASAPQRAGDDGREGLSGQGGAESAGGGATGGGQRDVRAAGVPARRAPLRLPVAHQPDVRSVHGSYDAGDEASGQGGMHLMSHTNITMYGTGWC